MRIRVAAPATEGKANRSLIAFLARCLDVPPSSVSVVGGATSRYKTVQIEGLTQDEALHRLRALAG
jgi:uncharacterized protein